MKVTLTASAIRPEAQAADRFHGVRMHDTIEKEEPRHRTAMYILASGADVKECAVELGVSCQTIYNWMRQSWFTERLEQIQGKARGSILESLIKAESLNSLTVMLEIRDNKAMPATVRNDICKNILDRYLGKPTQRVETQVAVTSEDPVAEAERLEQENARAKQNQNN